MAQMPRIRTLPLGKGSGTTTLSLAPGTMIGYGVIFEIWAGGDNALQLGSDSRIYEGTRLELRGGSIAIGTRCLIHDNAVLKSGGQLSLGDDISVSFGSCLHCSERIELGACTVLAEYVTITDSDHTPDGSDTPNAMRPIVTDPVLIEPNVLFGRSATVLRGATIECNSAFAANALVRRGSYPAGWLYAGAPAEAIHKLDERERARTAE